MSPDKTSQLDAAIAELLTPAGEWAALRRQAAVALAKQNKGAILNEGEIAVIEEYEAVEVLKGLPTDYRSGEPMERWHETIPQAAAAHNVTHMQIIRAKGDGCRAFRGRRIYSASLSLFLIRNPLDPRPAGRPTRITDELTFRICELIRASNFVETAARKAGVGHSTLASWKAKGAVQKKGIYRDFLDAIEEAEAEAEDALLQRALIESPRGALEILQRRFRDRWAERREITGAGGADLPTGGGTFMVPTVTVNFKTDGKASPFTITPPPEAPVADETDGTAKER